jgi:hypothetical protein
MTVPNEAKCFCARAVVSGGVLTSGRECEASGRCSQGEGASGTARRGASPARGEAHIFQSARLPAFWSGRSWSGATGRSRHQFNSFCRDRPVAEWSDLERKKTGRLARIVSGAALSWRLCLPQRKVCKLPGDLAVGQSGGSAHLA